ncbi:ankyrin repeat-containing protein [Cotonvirus japonicus]|uniref:Ankyrin repeat-containing protein n=1 Tax=Cotonvirus japonicus TaxID=2811091 RepID=A0ABM7NTB4_9VIRU|nr:ankyrin repeat-containing protein [Cotonvirus japonicus]BCS83414.1 ankyrin repeat-containing protein [Cotonvirus japonicus]
MNTEYMDYDLFTFDNFYDYYRFPSYDNELNIPNDNEKLFKKFKKITNKEKKKWVKFLTKTNFEILKLLDEHNLLDTEHLFVILNTATIIGNNEIIVYLINKGIDLSQKNNIVMCNSVASGNIETVKLFLENNNDYTINNIALKNAVRSEKCGIDIIKYLVNKGADINVDDNFCIKCAAYLARSDLIEFFIENGCDYKQHTEYIIKTIIMGDYYGGPNHDKASVKCLSIFLNQGITFEFLSGKYIERCFDYQKTDVIILLINNGVNLSFINNYNLNENQNENQTNAKLIQNIIELGVNPENLALFLLKVLNGEKFTIEQ